MSLISEFKEFINRGNVMDMAVGVVIGGAFTAVVTSLTGDIVKPLVDYVTGTNAEGIPNLQLVIPGTSIVFNFSGFISAVVQFLVTAVVVFALVKAFNKAPESGRKPCEGPGEDGHGEGGRQGRRREGGGGRDGSSDVSVLFGGDQGGRYPLPALLRRAARAGCFNP